MEMCYASKGIEKFVEVNIGNMNQICSSGVYHRMRMLETNEINHVISPIENTVDDSIILKYNTSGNYIMFRLLEQKKPDGNFIKNIFSQLIECIEEIKTYLLDANDLVMDPSYMFIDANGMQLKMLCVPGYSHSLRLQMKSFLEYLMKIFDHRDNNGVRILYDMYDKVSEECFGFSSLKKLLGCGNLIDSENVNEMTFDAMPFAAIGQNLQIENAVGFNTNQNISQNINQKSNNGIIKKTDTKDIEKREKNSEKNYEINYAGKVSSEDEKLNLTEDADENLDKKIIIVSVGMLLVFASVVTYIFFVHSTILVMVSLAAFLMMIGALAACMVSDKSQRDIDASMKEFAERISMTDSNANVKAFAERTSMTDSNANVKLFAERTSMTDSNANVKPFAGKTNAYDMDYHDNQVICKGTEVAKLVPLTNGALKEVELLNVSKDIVVGRDKKDTDYRLPTTGVSRVHARIFSDNNGIYVEDIGSTNGTFLNQERLEKGSARRLKKGDIVAFADEEFFVQ